MTHHLLLSVTHHSFLLACCLHNGNKTTSHNSPQHDGRRKTRRKEERPQGCTPAECGSNSSTSTTHPCYETKEAKNGTQKHLTSMSMSTLLMHLCIDMASSLPTNRRQRLLWWNLMSCRMQQTLLFDAAANELTTDISFIGITGDWCPALHRPEYSSATTRTQRMRCNCSGREIPSGWPLLAFGMRSSCKESFGRKSSSSAWR